MMEIRGGKEAAAFTARQTHQIGTKRFYLVKAATSFSDVCLFRSVTWNCFIIAKKDS